MHHPIGDPITTDDYVELRIANHIEAFNHLVAFAENVADGERLNEGDQKYFQELEDRPLAD